MIEDPTCYASPAQRSLLARLFASGLVDGFFLTGGTCLAVFYLHHRVSQDLDVFTTEERDLTELATPLRAVLRPERIVASTTSYWSGVVDDVRLDLVVDPLSTAGPRPRVTVEGTAVPIDVLENIGPNKIGALVSRGAPRDAIDCYVLYRADYSRFLTDYAVARTREGLLDDVLYARERLLLIAEDAADVVAAHAADLRIPIDAADLATTFLTLANLLNPHAAERTAIEGD